MKCQTTTGLAVRPFAALRANGRFRTCRVERLRFRLITPPKAVWSRRPPCERIRRNRKRSALRSCAQGERLFQRKSGVLVERGGLRVTVRPEPGEGFDGMTYQTTTGLVVRPFAALRASSYFRTCRVERLRFRLVTPPKAVWSRRPPCERIRRNRKRSALRRCAQGERMFQRKSGCGLAVRSFAALRMTLICVSLIGDRDGAMANAAIWRPVALGVFMALSPEKKALAAKIYCRFSHSRASIE